MDLTNPQIIMRDKENARLREELAAAQATIAEMRSNLLAASCYIDCLGGNSKAYRIAIALPANLDALHEARAQAVEEAKCFFDPHSEYFGDSIMLYLDGEAGEHRAQKHDNEGGRS